MNFIDIEYQNGQMRINPDKFFPCKQKEMKIVLKTIDLVLYDQWKIRDRIASYLRGAIEREKQALEKPQAELLDLQKTRERQIEIEKKLIESGEENPYIPGEYATKTEIKDKEKEVKKIEKQLAAYEKNLNRVEKEILK